MHSNDEHAVCRGCGKQLRGKPYWAGGSAYIPETGDAAKVNFYGGFVCSWQCDFNASLEQEQSMPGHGAMQRSIGRFAQDRLNSNWHKP